MPAVLSTVASSSTSNKARLLSILAIVVLGIWQRNTINWYARRLKGTNPDEHAVDMKELWPQFVRVANIATKSFKSKEVLGSLFFIGLFAMKAWSNVVRADADSQVVEAFIRGKARRGPLLHFITTSLFAASVAGLIEQVRFWLISSYRKTLTQYFQEKMFDKLAFYRSTLIDDRVQHGVYVASFCHEFAEHFAELPYYFVLPAAEAATALFFLRQQAGNGAALFVLSITLFSLVGLRRLTPKFGEMHAVLLEREEAFRQQHTEIRSHTEQLALHSAGPFLRQKLTVMFSSVKDALRQVAVAKGHFTMLQSGISLGLWDVIALLVCSRMATTGASRESVLRALLIQRQIIRKFHEAISALVENVKEASHLSEFTEKLYQFDALLQQSTAKENDDTRLHFDDFDNPAKRAANARIRARRLLEVPSSLSPITPLSPRSGGLEEVIRLEGVTVQTPTGQSLLKNLTLSVHRHQNWVIVGPNGTGKTSVMRVIAGLWKAPIGKVIVADSVDLHFLPQSAFLLSQATLFEQLAFPDEMFQRGQRARATSADLYDAKRAMSMAFAETVVKDVLGGWDSAICGFTDDLDLTFKWDSLSGGQQQKVALARLFFHAMEAKRVNRRIVAFMDESTSQIDSASEDIIFNSLREEDISYVSVTHRERVVKQHDIALVLTGQQKYRVEQLRPRHATGSKVHRKAEEGGDDVSSVMEGKGDGETAERDRREAVSTHTATTNHNNSTERRRSVTIADSDWVA